MPTTFYFKGDATFGANRIKTQLRDSRRKMAKKAEQLLLKPTATWSHKVRFTTKELTDTTSVTTDDEPYSYLDDGTKPHLIEGNPYLRFQENFKPKTAVNSLNSVYGGKSGPYVNPPPQIVKHPGNEARNFTEVVVQQLEPDFVDDVQKEIDKSLA